MESLVRMFVALGLTLLLAGACGGREGEDAATPETAEAGKAAAQAPNGAADTTDAGSNSLVDSAGRLSLTPEQADKLARVGRGYAAKNPRKAQRPTFTRLEAKDGQSIELPDDFPADIPIYPGAIATQHISSDTDGTMTVFETDESLDSARRHLSSALTNKGWSITGDMSKQGLTMLTAEKDGREISLAILADGGSTKITTIQN